VSQPQKTRRPPSPASRKGAQQDARRRLPLVAILIVVVAVVLVGAVFITSLGGGDDNGGDQPSNGGAVAEVQPVTVSGEPLAPFPGNGADDPSIGATAPVIDGKSFDGTPQSIGGATGRPSLLVFVAHWCPHCQAEVPRLVEWRADGTIPEDIDLVAVSTGVQSDLPNYPPSAWLEEERWPGGVLVDDADGTAAGYYGLPSYPYFVALDAEGRVVTRATGELDQQAIQDVVSKLQSG
jgi:thiol-disulfide isomerase/thioredoxin